MGVMSFWVWVLMYLLANAGLMCFFIFFWYVKPMFAWYDGWIGYFYDQKKHYLYIFPLPWFGYLVDLTTYRYREYDEFRRKSAEEKKRASIAEGKVEKDGRNDAPTVPRPDSKPQAMPRSRELKEDIQKSIFHTGVRPRGKRPRHR